MEINRGEAEILKTTTESSINDQDQFSLFNNKIDEENTASMLLTFECEFPSEPCSTYRTQTDQTVCIKSNSAPPSYLNMNRNSYYSNLCSCSETRVLWPSLNREITHDTPWAIGNDVINPSRSTLPSRSPMFTSQDVDAHVSGVRTSKNHNAVRNCCANCMRKKYTNVDDRITCVLPKADPKGVRWTIETEEEIVERESYLKQLDKMVYNIKNKAKQSEPALIDGRKGSKYKLDRRTLHCNDPITKTESHHETISSLTENATDGDADTELFAIERTPLLLCPPTPEDPF
eukprot:CFRG6697T1